MAQPPEFDETFLREVDENLRRDRMRDLFRSYGNWLILAVVLFLGASGGLIWWNQHQSQQREGQVEQLAQTYKDIGSGDLSKAPQQLDQLSSGSSKAVSASAQFARAAVALQQGNTKAATSTYKAIADDDSMPAPYRDAALVRQTSLEFDQLQPQAIVTRLADLAKPGEPWFGTAGELTALALLKQGKRQEAGQLFAAISRDSGVPQSIRARAAQVATTLGVDAGSAIQIQAQ